MKRSFFWLMSILLVLCGNSFAEVKSPDPAAFDYTLQKLHQSVAELSKENQELKARNTGVRVKVGALTAKLTAMQEDVYQLKKRKAVQTVSPKGGGGLDSLKAQIVRLNQELTRIGQESVAVDAQMKLVEEAERVYGQKISRLEAENKAAPADGVLLAEWQKALADLQAERDRLRQEAQEATARYNTAKTQWVDLDAAITHEPEQFESIRAEQESVTRETAAIEAELPKLKASMAEAQAEVQRLDLEDNSELKVGRMESEIKAITERSRSLELELLTRQKVKDGEFKRVQDERAALEVKYKGEIDALTVRNTALRQELDGLRKAMVALDKKKSALELDAYTPR